MVKEAAKTPGKRARVPIEEGLFTLPASAAEQPRLIASRCKKCGEVFFPKRIACLKCTAMDMEEMLLSTRGKLYSFAITRLTPPGSVVKAPYVLASVEMPEGVNVHTVLTDCEVDKVQIGDTVELVLETFKHVDIGREVVAFKFKPV